MQTIPFCMHKEHTETALDLKVMLKIDLFLKYMHISISIFHMVTCLVGLDMMHIFATSSGKNHYVVKYLSWIFRFKYFRRA